MIQELFQNAIRFAAIKHGPQKLPGSDINYLVHISNVVIEVMMAYKFKENFDLKFSIQLAVLHDTLEDTNTSYQELKNQFGKDIADAVDALTKKTFISNKKDKMDDSLERINLLGNEVGLVKLADRITNLQKPPENWSKAKVKAYYFESGRILDSLSSKNDYLADRLKYKIKEYCKYI